MWTTEELDNLVIKQGKHKPPNGSVEACAMEASYLRWAVKQGWNKKKIVTGWSDSLDCVCPYIGAFVRCWNDAIKDDEVRTRIFTPEFLDLLPGTKGDDALMLRRMWMGIDWDIRVRTPAFLRLAKLDAIADALAAMALIDSQAKLNDARAMISEARRQGAAARAAARAAAGAAAGDAAWDAAGDAAGAAAWAAAWAAVRAAAGAAAWAAARDAAGDAARDAAWAAAWDAAWAAARDAAWAAARDAAGDAARDAAWAAAWDAAWGRSQAAGCANGQRDTGEREGSHHPNVCDSMRIEDAVSGRVVLDEQRQVIGRIKEVHLPIAWRWVWVTLPFWAYSALWLVVYLVVRSLFVLFGYDANGYRRPKWMRW